MPWTRLRCAGIALAAALLAGCTGDGGEPPPDAKPANVGAITKISYDGVRTDLLTAGLGRTGLGGTAPVPANPAAPMAAETPREHQHPTAAAIQARGVGPPELAVRMKPGDCNQRGSDRYS